MLSTPIALTSDHAGYELKQKIIEFLTQQNIAYDDLGAYSAASSDYPDYGHKMGEAISSGKYEMGITICGSGNGINMVANKHRGVRGAICWSEEISKMARKHNDANVCAIPARYVDTETAIAIVGIFLKTGFDGGRHERRKKKIDL